MQLQKSRTQQLHLEESKKSLMAAYQAQGSSNRKSRDDYHHLREIAQLLDHNYADDSEDDDNEVRILMKISE